jgi:hypothetical protein
MKLKQIEDIATRQVPIWQPALLVVLLLLGNVIVPNILKQKETQSSKKESVGMTLGENTIKKRIEDGVQKVILPYSEELQKEAGKVLGIAQVSVQQTVQNFASNSAEQAKEFVFDNTLGKVLQNINTLPTDQQELIKKAICK